MRRSHLGQQGRCERHFVVDFKLAQAQVGLGPSLVLGKRLAAPVDRRQAGNGRRRYGQNLGGVPQEVSVQRVETVAC
jgi:hypothetical protein